MTTQRINRLIGVFIILFSLFLFGQLKDLPREGTLFPSFLLYGLLLSAGLMILRSLLPGFKREKIIVFQDIPARLWLSVVGILVLYVIGMFHLGFYVSTFLASLCVLFVLSHSQQKRAILGNLLFAVGWILFYYLFFTTLLKVPFPSGVLV